MMFLTEFVAMMESFSLLSNLGWLVACKHLGFVCELTGLLVFGLILPKEALKSWVDTCQEVMSPSQSWLC